MAPSTREGDLLADVVRVLGVHEAGAVFEAIKDLKNEREVAQTRLARAYNATDSIDFYSHLLWINGD